MISTRYPIYIPSKGRYLHSFTAKMLAKGNLDFKIVVEPQEQDHYAVAFGAERLLVLPFSNLGLGSIPARNWIWEHAKASGAEKHWILDDNIRRIVRMWRGVRRGCSASPALRAVEDFIDRYENVAIAGMNYSSFGVGSNKKYPFLRNVHVYSCMLIMNSLPYRWRGKYNEDTDLCLQVLSNGWCTVLVNAFMIDKYWTMVIPGGNSAELYAGDGRLRMARSLERQWPGVVEVRRRFGRPQHMVKSQWRKFDTPLKFKNEVRLDGLQPNEYGLKLVAADELLDSRRGAGEEDSQTSAPVAAP